MLNVPKYEIWHGIRVMNCFLPNDFSQMKNEEKLELIRQMSGLYETTPEEFRARLDKEIKTHKKAIEICNIPQLREILKDSLIKLQELKIQDGEQL